MTVENIGERLRRRLRPKRNGGVTANSRGRGEGGKTKRRGMELDKGPRGWDRRFSACCVGGHVYKEVGAARADAAVRSQRTRAGRASSRGHSDTLSPCGQAPILGHTRTVRAAWPPGRSDRPISMSRSNAMGLRQL
jgi:hypothetical protein